MVRREIESGAFLANLPLFKELGPASVARIAEGATKLKLARGATVFRRGDTPTGFFVVAFGEVRLITYLLRGRADASGETSVTLPATKAAVASQLGLTPEHFSRILHDLAARALLRVDGRRIVIADAARLASHARGQATI